MKEKVTKYKNEFLILNFLKKEKFPLQNLNTKFKPLKYSLFKNYNLSVNVKTLLQSIIQNNF